MQLQKSGIILGTIECHEIEINADIIDLYIPLLFQMQINFYKDSSIFIVDSIPFITTSNWLYRLPLTEMEVLLNKVLSVNIQDKIILCVIEPKTNK